MEVEGGRREVKRKLMQIGIDYDPGPCRYVKVVIDDNNKRIVRVECWGD